MPAITLKDAYMEHLIREAAEERYDYIAPLKKDQGLLRPLLYHPTQTILLPERSSNS